jgi:uroporphyrin-III C-methyltransferase
MSLVDYRSALPAEEAPRPGEVWLIGAGPGDPGLLTLRAAEALKRADLVLHDALPGRAVLRLVRPGASILAVGKRKGHAPMGQAKINARLVAGARAGQRVVCLKGGDPFVFGRGGEEAQALAEAGIPWRVVPGVSAGLAAPAAAGIPLTHRGVSSAVTFVTGHDEAGELPGTVDWAALARAGGTIAAFMALTKLDEIALRLLAAGRPAATPVAVVAQASLPGQAVLRTTLGACTLEARRAGLPTPALVVIGEVAALSATMLPPAALPGAEAPARPPRRASAGT